MKIILEVIGTLKIYHHVYYTAHTCMPHIGIQQYVGCLSHVPSLMALASTSLL